MKGLRVLSAAFIGLLSFAGLAKAADEDAVTPELAKKAAVYLAKRYWFGGDNDSGVKVSPVRVIYDKTHTRRYYSLFVYAGTGSIPTWEDIEKDPDAYLRLENKPFVSFIIPADKNEWFFVVGKNTIPVICEARRTERLLKSRYPNDKWVFKETIVGSLFNVYYEYSKNGRETVYAVAGGYIASEDDIGTPSIVYDHNFDIWEKVEESDMTTGSLQPDNALVAD
jgi:hypothetical protein